MWLQRKSIFFSMHDLEVCVFDFWPQEWIRTRNRKPYTIFIVDNTKPWQYPQLIIIILSHAYQWGCIVSAWLFINTIWAVSVISWGEQVTFQGDNDEVRFILDQHA
jgi:hypothetical protein